MQSVELVCPSVYFYSPALSAHFTQPGVSHSTHIRPVLLLTQYLSSLSQTGHRTDDMPPHPLHSRLRLALTRAACIARSKPVISEPIGSIQCSILNRLRYVRNANRTSALKIGYSASYFKNPVVRPCRKSLSLHHLF